MMVERMEKSVATSGLAICGSLRDGTRDQNMHCGGGEVKRILRNESKRDSGASRY